MTPLPRDLTRIVLAVLAVGAMIVFSFWIVKPFVPATIWATTIVTATWPMMCAVQRRLWGKRWLAVLAMTLAMLLIFVVPFTLMLRTIVHHEHTITGWAKTAASFRLTEPPAWVAKLPMVGESAVREWTRYSREGAAELEAMIAGHTGQLMSWFVAEVGALGVITGQFLLTVAIAAILYGTGEHAAHGVRLFLRRLAGHHGDTVMSLVGRAIRGVILGTIVAGLVIAILSGVGLGIARVPAALLLTAFMFLLYLVQIGTVPVLGRGGHLALRDGPFGHGHLRARLDGRNRRRRFGAASFPHEDGRRTPAPAHLHRSRRRHGRVRLRGHLRRARSRSR